ncbi:MAG: SsrA-binding protein SmpB [Clostridia bacterium]|nr:SsrA-binding protein SmpB [Clostridia bacterium]MBP5666164.1 SsrA-binding protein SmpB [Clostridia bacterium]MBP5766981.1 SsrA-binding protein SmpB [Clostridia bacterium]
MSYSKEQKKIIVQNRSAFHEYFIEDKVECGIELFGTEVKSIRQGKVNLKEAYAVIEKGECFICGMHISPYEHGNIFNRDPLRKRRLLLHKREILKLYAEVKQQGVTLVPLEIYFVKGRAKLLMGVGRGKKLYDKRDQEAERASKREIERNVKNY